MAPPLTLADHPARLIAASFGEHLARTRLRSAHTVRAYVATAHRLVAFLGEHRGEAVDAGMLAALDAADLRAYLARRRDAGGLTNASAARELSAVRAFLDFANGGPSATPRIRAPRVKKGVPRPVAPAEATDLAHDAADAQDKPWLARRDLAVLLLLYGAGLRVGEAMALDARLLPLGETIMVTGKGSKQRVVPLLPVVRQAIADYAAECPYPLSAGTPLFRGARGAGSMRGLSAGRCAPRGCASACRSGRRPTRFATASRRICWREARICASCRSCSAMRASPPRRSTRPSTRPI